MISRAAFAPGPPGNSTARMRACAAEIESLDRSSILRPADDWAEGEKLIERLFAVMNVSAAQSVCLFQIKRRDDLPGDN